MPRPFGRLFLAAIVLLAATASQAQTYEALHTFDRMGSPTKGLTLAPDGNLYSVNSQYKGHGAIYRVEPSGAFSIVHQFSRVRTSYEQSLRN